MWSRFNYNSFIQGVQLICPASLHSTPTAFGHWYTKLQRIKPVRIPRKNAPTFSFDWEHNRFKKSAATAIIPYVENNEDFKKLNDGQKKLFSYGFNSISYDYNLQLLNFMRSHGSHPVDDSLFAKVLNMSFKIWYNKHQLEKQPRVITLRGATESLVQRRMRLLRRLRAMNTDDYQKALSILKLKDAVHLDPYQLRDTDEVHEKKQKIRNECYQLRLAKLARMKKDQIIQREAFFIRKQSELQYLVDRLCELEDGKENKEKIARQHIKELFDIVITERQTVALAPTRADRLWWYAKEAVLRRHVADSIAEREAQHLKQRRK